MSRTATGPRGGHGWQLILADLALILFLLSLSALPAAEAETRQKPADQQARGAEAARARRTEVAAAQALYRPVASGPSLGAWLATQQPDPRTTLTIFAVHTKDGEVAAWARTQALAQEARTSGAQVRVIITTGATEDIYASLAYDEVIASTGSGDRS